MEEAERLRILEGYDVLDTAPEADLDALVRLASAICGTPVALISLVDSTRQWFKAKVGLGAQETPRDVAFCAHAVAGEGAEVFTVRDARSDARFASNPLVTGDPKVVFYAGAPLVGEQGAKLGTLCVIDHTPRELTAMQEQALETLSKVVVQHLELRRLHDERGRLLREAENANRTMDEFLATVSHELRTPLNAILGWARLLRSNQVPESARPRALETIERNATIQAQLVGDLLDVSRIMSGKMRLEVVRVDLVSVIEAALEVVRPAAGAKGVQLDALLDPTAGEVSGDSARLQQVAWNLLANAVKFTPQGGRVEARLVRDGAFVEVSVTDSGVGIDPAFLPHAFERFRQADAAATRIHGGLGLGLAIVKNLAELHGGTVRATSAGLGRGASFIVRLPRLFRSGEIPPGASATPARVEAPLGDECPPEISGLRVLVVDDEEDARDLLIAILERCGVRVTAVGSAEEALRALDTETPAVILSDLGMPGEDGCSLLRRVRARPASRGGRVPAVALTAFARAEDRTRALRAGFNLHVPKPVEPSELLAVLVSLLERQSGI